MRIMRNPYKGSYDELCSKVNETYKRTNDVRETVKETGIDPPTFTEQVNLIYTGC